MNADIVIFLAVSGAVAFVMVLLGAYFAYRYGYMRSNGREDDEKKK